MPYEQVKDLVRKLARFHGEISSKFETMESSCRREKVKMLLDYMTEHEKKLETGLLEFEKTADPALMKTYFSFTPDRKRWEALQAMQLAEDASFRDAVDLVLEADQLLLDLLQEIVCNTETEDVHRLFQSLLENARKQRNKFVRDALMLEEC